MYREWQSNSHTDQQSNRYTDRLRDRNTDKCSDSPTHGLTLGPTLRPTLRPNYKPTLGPNYRLLLRQTHGTKRGQTLGHPHWPTYRETDTSGLKCTKTRTDVHTNTWNDAWKDMDQHLNKPKFSMVSMVVLACMMTLEGVSEFCLIFRGNAIRYFQRKLLLWKLPTEWISFTKGDLVNLIKICKWFIGFRIRIRMPFA